MVDLLVRWDRQGRVADTNFDAPRQRFHIILERKSSMIYISLWRSLSGLCHAETLSEGSSKGE